MKTMKQLKTFLLIATGLVAFPTNSLAVTTPTKFPTDVVQFGKSGSTADHKLVFDFGLGASNPALSSDSATNSLGFSKNTFSLGDGAATAKTLTANIGAGASNPKIKFDTAGNEWQFSADGTNFDSFGSGSGGGAGVNLLKNPGFESGVVQGWTTTGGTFSQVTAGANLLVGKGSGLFTASAGGQSVQSTLYAIPVGLQGKACSADLLYLGGSANLKFQAITNASVVLASQVLAVQTVVTSVHLTFPCPSSGSVQVQVLSTGSSAALAMDQMTLGTNPLVQVSQAQYFGGISVIDNGTPTCNWNTSSASYADFSAATNCVYTTKGNAVAPATMLPAIKFNSMPAGEYYVVGRGELFASHSSATDVQVMARFFDGTNSLGDNRQGIAAAATGTQISWGQVITGHLSLATAVGPTTISAQMKAISAATSYAIDTNSPQPFTIDVYFFPAQSSIVTTADTLAQTFAAEHGTDCTWTTTSTSFVEPSPDATCTFTVKSSKNFGTVTSYLSGGDSMPGVVLATVPGTEYELCAKIMGDNSTGYSTFILTDGTTDYGQSTIPSTGASIQSEACALFTASSLSTSIRLKMKASTGTTSIGNGLPVAIQWRGKATNQQTPSPYIVGTVLSPSAGITNLISFKFADSVTSTTACSATCGVYQADVSGISVVHNASGDYTATLPAGVFGSAPLCWVQMTDTSVEVANLSPMPTSTSVHVLTGGVDVSALVFCKGVK